MSREKRISTYLFVAWFFERKTKKKWITPAAMFIVSKVCVHWRFVLEMCCR